jgi:hypothetical protein
MYFTDVEITGTVERDAVTVESDQTKLSVDDIYSVNVPLFGEHEASGTTETAFICEYCNDPMASLEATETEDGDDVCAYNSAHDDEGEEAPHHAIRKPLTWANSAGIRFDEEEDRIQVSISVGDPRGALVMEVWMGEDGNLRLSVPHHSDSSKHVEMKHEHDGYYVLGS